MITLKELDELINQNKQEYDDEYESDNAREEREKREDREYRLELGLLI